MNRALMAMRSCVATADGTSALAIPVRHHGDDLEVLPPVERDRQVRNAPDPEYLTILSSAPYRATQNVLAHNGFQAVDNQVWPTAAVEEKTVKGFIQLRPPKLDEFEDQLPDETAAVAEAMWRYREELSDLDVDVLDLLSALWLEQAKGSEDFVVATVDELLRMRGLKRKQGGAGRRGGFEPEQRDAVRRSLAHVQSLYLILRECDVYEGSKRRPRKRCQALWSPAFLFSYEADQLDLDGTMQVEQVRFRPGDVYAAFLSDPGRQTAILSVKAVEYDYRQHSWEKRLARYFSYLWRTSAKSGQYNRSLRVKTLLGAVGQVLDRRHPMRTRDRLEEALDRLEADGVVAGWQYDHWEEDTGRGWAEEWLQATIAVEAPEAVKEQYRSIQRQEPQKVLAVVRQDIGDRVRRRRQELGLTQACLAEQLGVNRTVVSDLETGHLARMQPSLKRKIEAWLKD